MLDSGECRSVPNHTKPIMWKVTVHLIDAKRSISVAMYKQIQKQPLKCIKQEETWLLAYLKASIDVGVYKQIH